MLKSGAAICPASDELKPANAVARTYGFSFSGQGVQFIWGKGWYTAPLAHRWCSKTASRHGKRAAFRQAPVAQRRGLAVIHCTCRTLVTITWWLSRSSSRLIHADCEPVGKVIRARPRWPKCFSRELT